MRRAAVLAFGLVLAGCQQNTVDQQTAALTLSPQSLARHQAELRRFDTTDETFILNAAAGVMQDLGFTIEESSAEAGLIIGSKDRDAVEAQQVAGQVILVLLAAAAGVPANPIYDSLQKIRISVSTRPSADKTGVVARVTFQRVVWNNQARVSKLETIDDAQIYREFFERLSKSVFLEAHEI
jgi:hypothetical protein